mmetsp:Transcript_3706/g.10736  ORF Transcript_3706/g.10736 Transcript_3706/m.10736 type:complete len:647 (+) Transcript_3706:187-2127(+)
MLRGSHALFRLGKALSDASSRSETFIAGRDGLLRFARIAAGTTASGTASPPFRGDAQCRCFAAEPDFEYRDDRDGLEPRDADEYGSLTEYQVVTGRRRRLEDFEELIGVLARRRRSFKIRDVFEEMDLDGVAPGAMTYFRAMFACMKARRLGDTLYYWNRMLISGIQPDPRTYGVVISAAGRAGHTVLAVELMDEMRARGHLPTKNTYLAALNALAESARITDAWKLVEEMQTKGIPPDEFVYTAIINAYKRAHPPPDDAEARVDEVLMLCRTCESMEFSRRRPGCLGIISANASLNTFCDLGLHGRVVSMFQSLPEEGLVADYDSYSAIIRSYLKETVREYSSFAATHPGSAAHVDLIDSRMSESQTLMKTRDLDQRSRPVPPPPPGPDGKLPPAFVLEQKDGSEDAIPDDPTEIDPEYQHLESQLALHLTRLKKRVNLKMWGRVIELYDEAAHQGISLSPGVYYDLMRAAVLVASSGRPEALGFAEHCLQEMSHLGMFLNTQNGSAVLAACSRRELPSGLAFAHRLWDVLVLNGRVPKTHAIKAYLGALREREPQWRDRIEQVTRVAAIDPSRLRMHAHTPQKKSNVDMAMRKYVKDKRAHQFGEHGFTAPLKQPLRDRNSPQWVAKNDLPEWKGPGEDVSRYK